jgi:hypothetical protein
MNQGEGETDLGEDEIGQPDSDQASNNIVQSSAEFIVSMPRLIHILRRLSTSINQPHRQFSRTESWVALRSRLITSARSFSISASQEKSTLGESSSAARN